MATYTRDNVLEAMQAYIDKHNKLPRVTSGLIAKCSLANGQRLWQAVGQAFYADIIEGLEEKVTFRDFVKKAVSEN